MTHSAAINQTRGTFTLTTLKDVRSYPCRSLESATKLAERFIAGVTKPRPAAPARDHPRTRCRAGGGVAA